MCKSFVTVVCKCGRGSKNWTFGGNLLMSEDDSDRNEFGIIYFLFWFVNWKLVYFFALVLLSLLLFSPIFSDFLLFFFVIFFLFNGKQERDVDVETFFNVFDRGSKGFITASDVSYVLACVDPNAGEEQVKEFMNLFQTNVHDAIPYGVFLISMTLYFISFIYLFYFIHLFVCLFIPLSVSVSKSYFILFYLLFYYLII